MLLLLIFLISFVYKRECLPNRTRGMTTMIFVFRTHFFLKKFNKFFPPAHVIQGKPSLWTGVKTSLRQKFSPFLKWKLFFFQIAYSVFVHLLGLLFSNFKCFQTFWTHLHQGKAILIPFYYYFLFFVSYIKNKLIRTTSAKCARILT